MRSIAIVFAILVASNFAETRALEFYQVPQPNSTYVNGTTLMSLASIADGTTLNSVTTGPQTVSFDATVTKYSVPLGWENWGSPPNTESSTPDVLVYESTNPLQLTLSVASKTFGFELQGADPAVESQFIVRFFDGSTEVGSIDRTVNGNSGALLFAGNSPTNAFTHVIISNPSGNSQGWGIANIRYSVVAVPEPSTYLMSMLATLALGSIARRRKAKASHSGE